MTDDTIEVPPDLYVALEWAAASGELPALRTLDADALAALCDGHGGPLLTELM